MIPALISPGEFVSDLSGSLVVTVVTAGTRVQVTSTETFCSGVVITADESNPGILVIGGSDVVAASGTSRRGVAVLQPGASAVLGVNNLATLYADSTTGSNNRALVSPIKG